MSRYCTKNQKDITRPLLYNNMYVSKNFKPMSLPLIKHCLLVQMNKFPIFSHYYCKQTINVRTLSLAINNDCQQLFVMHTVVFLMISLCFAQIYNIFVLKFILLSR